MDQAKPTKFGVAGSNPVEGSIFIRRILRTLEEIKTI